MAVTPVGLRKMELARGGLWIAPKRDKIATTENTKALLAGKQGKRFCRKIYDWSEPLQVQPCRCKADNTPILKLCQSAILQKQPPNPRRYLQKRFRGFFRFQGGRCHTRP